jgi:hypothetical protein
MNTRPSLLRSIPFWILVVASLISAAFGSWILKGKLDAMTATLTDGSATAVDVYVGPSIALLGAILIGVGALGILLALAVAAAASLRPKAAAEVVEPIDWSDEELVGTVSAQGPAEVEAVPADPADAPLAEAEAAR